MTEPVFDPVLDLAAAVVDDLERVRIANENRLRQLTRAETDSDGEERGFGLTPDHPDVARLAVLVEALNEAEKRAISNLEHRMRRHPLGSWVKSIRGVGLKQAARLLAAIGDPYWNDLHDRPRLVSELWSYCGYGDAERQIRRKGAKANWSDDAKKRAWVVAESIQKQLVKPCYSVKDEDGKYLHAVHVEDCKCSPYRVLYDQTRSKYSGAVHAKACVRCGPSGKPAQPGSPISATHNKARAYRAVSKALLKDLWHESKRLHEFN